MAIKSFIEAALQMRANNFAHICNVCLLPWNAGKKTKTKSYKIVLFTLTCLTVATVFLSPDRFDHGSTKAHRGETYPVYITASAEAQAFQRISILTYFLPHTTYTYLLSL